VTLAGLTFSDELGGLVIVSGRGSGSLDDPFVLVEEITARGPAILVIRGLTSDFGNRIGSQHITGFALTKIVRNGSGRAWRYFELELRETLDRRSPYEDGLSFGQGSNAGRPFRANAFSEVREIQEPLDAISFSGGRVDPGAAVTLSVVITESTPKPVFYLAQKHEPVLSRRPETDGEDRAIIASVGE